MTAIPANTHPAGCRACTRVRVEACAPAAPVAPATVAGPSPATVESLAALARRVERVRTRRGRILAALW